MDKMFYVEANSQAALNMLGKGKALCLNVTHTGDQAIFICVSNGGAKGVYEKGQIVEVKSRQVVYGGAYESEVDKTAELEGDNGEVQKALEEAKKEIHSLKTQLGKLKAQTEVKSNKEKGNE